MNRDEILSKVKDEKGYDEREEKVFMEAFSISSIITQIFCIIFIIMRIVKGMIIGKNDNISELVSLIFVQFTISKFYQVIKLKRKRDILLLIIYILITLIFIEIFIETA